MAVTSSTFNFTEAIPLCDNTSVYNSRHTTVMYKHLQLCILLLLCLTWIIYTPVHSVYNLQVILAFTPNQSVCILCVRVRACVCVRMLN